MAEEFIASEEVEAVARQVVTQPEVSLAVLSLYKDIIERSPSSVAESCGKLYFSLAAVAETVGLFDEKDYLLGEFARYAGWGCRLIGRYQDAERWLDRADTAYRHTVNPAPLLANVAYAKLAIRYETHRFEDVLELAPSLIESFEKLSMSLEAAKAQYLLGVSLRAAGRASEAFELYNTLQRRLEEAGEKKLRGQLVAEMGDYCGSEGRFGEALSYYREAVQLLADAGRPAALAQLKWAVGSTYRTQGQLTAALDAYRESRDDFRQLGMRVFESHVGLAIADTLLSLGRPREAEWEILAALPMIEVEEIGVEVAAAVALLRESARQKKASPEALRELRELLAKS